MDHAQTLLLELFLMFAGARLLGWIAGRLKQPAVVGELVAGVLLGPSLLGWIHRSEMNSGMAEIGAIFLLFTVGLETRPRDLMQVGRIAVLVAAGGVALPFLLGYGYMRLTDHAFAEAIFLGAAMVATSVGITAGVLKQCGALGSRAARVILGAAVVDDVLGMLILAMAGSLATGPVSYLQLTITAGEAILFFGLLLLFGSRVMHRLQPAVERIDARHPEFTLAVVLCLGLSLASVHIGMAAIIGAFLAGLVLSEQSTGWNLEERFHPLYEFLTPFFFVYLGAEVNLRSFHEPGMPMIATVVFLLAAFSKLAGCGLAALELGWHDALRVGVGMIPRGEVGLIVAGVGLRLGVIPDSLYLVVILMSLLTTLAVPPVLRPLFSAASAPADGNSL